MIRRENKVGGVGVIELLGRVAKEATRPHAALLATTDVFLGPATLVFVPERSRRSMSRWLGHAFGEL